VVALKAGDIDSKRMLLPVERDKGGKSLPSRRVSLLRLTHTSNRTAPACSERAVA